jgi:hypothetical protein
MKLKNQYNKILPGLRRRGLDLFFLIAAIGLGLFLGWDYWEAAIFGVFVWSLLGPLESQKLAWGALIFMIISAGFLMSGRESRAEEFALYAYYFLVMTVIRAVLETRKADLTAKHS